MKPHFLPQAKRNEWLSSLIAGNVVFFPAVVDDTVHWRRLATADLNADSGAPEWGLRRIRAAEPIKGFFFAPREKVATFPGKTEPGVAEKRILFGAKSCDLMPLRVHGKMFLDGDFKDDFYEARRKNTLIIAADCPEPADSCFCNLVGNKPYVTDADKAEADVVLSVVEGGWLLEPLTDRGAELLQSSGATEATEAQVAARAEVRKAAEAGLKAKNPKQFPDDLPARVWKRNQDDAFWAKHAETCVECYACLMACPTCYCYLLYDKAKEAGMERTRVWDACYVAAYARVGGGANPRAEFVKRFYNRFYCKFSHFKTWQEMYACSGCGRCYKACMGKIDIRKVLLEV